MAIQSKAAAQIMLDKYYEAELAVAEGKGFTFATENGTRQVTMQDLPEIRKTITILERRVMNTSGQKHAVTLANFNH